MVLFSKIIRRLFIVSLIFIPFLEIQGKDTVKRHNKIIKFEQHFNDSTLRLDYIFGSGPSGPRVFLESMTKQAGWAGRKSRLNEVPLQGNGTVIVTDSQSGDTIYMNPFSTLSQEWFNSSESLLRDVDFENSFLVPLPKTQAIIRIVLRDNHFNEIATSEAIYDPTDELIAVKGETPFPYEYLHKGSSDNNSIDIAILAEGYREEEMDRFIERAGRIKDEILSYEPFKSNKEKFNFIAVKTPSKDSGVSIPSKNIWKNTLFKSHFSTFHSERYLTVPRVWRMHESLEGIPYEHIFLIVNTQEYGGGGFFNSYQVASSDNELKLPVAVHEFGHSFAGLADEYFYEGEEDDTYPLDVEPWEGNITTLVDFNQKWVEKLLPGTTIPTPWEDSKNQESDTSLGVYEGGGYRIKGVYRPMVTCRMRDNFHPTFCPVCEEILESVINFYTE